MMPPLTAEQDTALTALLDAVRAGSRVSVLTGPAGSGKTTVMRTFVERLIADGYDVRLFAPTNKAALRLAATTGRDVSTIHSALYSKIWEDEAGDIRFANPRAIVDKRQVAIVDEASMVGSRLANDIETTFPENAAIVYVGDPNQIPPVEDTWGAPMLAPTAHLDTIHRQANDNPIIAFAMAIRLGKGKPWLAEWVAKYQTPDAAVYLMQIPLHDVVHWYIGAILAGLDVQAIAWTHAQRVAFNADVRAIFDARGWDRRVVIRENDRDRGIVNGDVWTFKAARKLAYGGHVGTLVDETCTPPRTINRVYLAADDLWEAAPTAWRDFRKQHRYVTRVTDGYCVTIHSAQGSQWDVVLILVDPRLFDAAQRRLLYTAVTRAAKRVILVLLGG